MWVFCWEWFILQAGKDRARMVKAAFGPKTWSELSQATTRGRRRASGASWESLETDSVLGEKWCLETWKGIYIYIYMVVSHASMHHIRRMWFEYLYVAAQLMSVSAPHHIALPLTLSGMAYSFLVLIAFFHETSAKLWWMARIWPCSFCSCDYLCDIYCNEYHINQRPWTMIRWCLVHLET